MKPTPFDSFLNPLLDQCGTLVLLKSRRSSLNSLDLFALASLGPLPRAPLYFGCGAFPPQPAPARTASATKSSECVCTGHYGPVITHFTGLGALT